MHKFDDIPHAEGLHTAYNSSLFQGAPLHGVGSRKERGPGLIECFRNKTLQEFH